MSKYRREPLVRSVVEATGRVDKDSVSRAIRFDRWNERHGQSWDAPDFQGYANYLEQERHYAPATAAAHVSTLRALYQDLVKPENWELRQKLLAEAAEQGGAHATDAEHSAHPLEQTDAEPRSSTKSTEDGSPASRIEKLTMWRSKAPGQYADPASTAAGLEALRKIRQYFESKQVALNVQGGRTPQKLALGPREIQQLVKAPSASSLPGLRDTTLIITGLCTGLSAKELGAIRVLDIRQEFEGALALHVPPAEGCTERCVPYGAFGWVLRWLETWLDLAGIEDGPVFRALPRGNQELGDTGLSTQAINDILGRYPIQIGGETVVVRPNDLRRTYARMLHASGMDLRAIGANLGLQDLNAVAEYLEPLNPSERVIRKDLYRLKSFSNPEQRARDLPEPSSEE